MMGLRPDKKKTLFGANDKQFCWYIFWWAGKKDGRWRIHSLWSVQIPMIKHRGKQVVLVSKHIHYICIALFNAFCLVPGLSMLKLMITLELNEVINKWLPRSRKSSPELAEWRKRKRQKNPHIAFHPPLCCERNWNIGNNTTELKSTDKNNLQKIFWIKKRPVEDMGVRDSGGKGWFWQVQKRQSIMSSDSAFRFVYNWPMAYLLLLHKRMGTILNSRVYF